MFQRLPLRYRLMITVSAAIIAVQALNAYAFYILPKPSEMLFSSSWLIEQMTRACDAIFTAEREEREAIAATFSKRDTLMVSWQERVRLPKSAFDDQIEQSSPFVNRLRAALGDKARDIKIVTWNNAPHRMATLTFVPKEAEQELANDPMSGDWTDQRIIQFFDLAIQGKDGTWLHVRPWPPLSIVGLPMHVFLPLMFGSLAVVALSISVARQALRPVEHLVAQANTKGSIRDFAPIPVADLGELSPIAVAINDMQARIKVFVDERTHMLAAISHDLRTMLTRLRLLTEELGESPGQQAVIDNIIEMERMLAATLAFAGEDLAEEQVCPVDLAALLITLCDQVDDVGGQAHYRGPDHALLSCRPIGMKRALMNLIDNAVKYGGAASVSLEVTQKTLVVEVSDRGPGIAPEHRDNAMKPFWRLEGSRNRKTGGAGLGLAIARDVIVSHGGSITLRDAIPQGLSVVVVLPKSPVAKA